MEWRGVQKGGFIYLGVSLGGLLTFRSGNRKIGREGGFATFHGREGWMEGWRYVNGMDKDVGKRWNRDSWCYWCSVLRESIYF